MADQDELRAADRPRRRSRSRTRSREHGVELDRALEARSQLENAAAYLELHIEQGPVLESMDLPLGAVLGTFGVERHRITWRGQAAHAGSTPMDQRRDALAGAAKLALELREIAARAGDGAVLHERRRRLQAGDRHLGRRDGRAAARPCATSTRTSSRRCWEQVREACERFARGGEHRGRVGADLGDRADPLRRDADRLRRRGDPRGRRHVAPAPERPAPRRRRGLARRRADGDALRPEPARPLAHEARGHEARAPRARRAGARPPGHEDDRLGRLAPASRGRSGVPRPRNWSRLSQRP